MHLVWYLFLGKSNGWEQIFYRQLAKIAIEVLGETIDHVHVIVRGDIQQRASALDSILKLLSDSVVQIIELPIDEEDKSEYAPINYIWELSMKASIQNIMYIHLKGVSYLEVDLRKYICSLEWGDFLEWAILERTRLNLKVLTDGKYDVLGCNFAKYNYREEERSAFSGNFWIAQARHIHRLEKPKTAKELINKYGNDKKNSWRLYYEYWITSVKGNYINAYKSHSIKDLSFHYYNRISRKHYDITSRI